MKKSILTIAIFAACTATFAQSGWQKSITEGDELKGTTGRTNYYYTQEKMGTFLFWGKDIQSFAIRTAGPMFHTTALQGNVGNLALIGIYDDSGNLKERLKVWLDLDDNSGHKALYARQYTYMTIYGNQKKPIKKIIDALMSGSGYIRILTSRYQTTDFDMTIPHYSE